MKKLILIIALLFIDSQASATGVISVNLGNTFGNVELTDGVNTGEVFSNGGIAVGASIGYLMTDSAQWDIVNFGFAQNAFNDAPEIYCAYVGSCTLNRIEVGTQFRFGMLAPKRRFKPFATVGIGGVGVHGRGAGENEWSFQWSVGAGVSTHFSFNQDLEVGIRYNYAEASEEDDLGITGTLGSHKLLLEMQYYGLR